MDVNVTAIREVKDLTQMTLNELIANLNTYEINMGDHKKEQVVKERSPL